MKLTPLREAMTWLGKKKIILKQVKKDNNIIYGAQAIKKHIGFMARPTKDYDILSPRPRRSANKLDKTLDKHTGGDFYFVKPADHPGTFKVKHRGRDRRKNTDDDLEVADFTKPTRRMKTKTIQGIRYARLSESIKDKKKAIADPQYAFRRAKDQDDLDRIRFAKKMKIRRR